MIHESGRGLVLVIRRESNLMLYVRASSQSSRAENWLPQSQRDSNWRAPEAEGLLHDD
jgi:hypothetical protein